MKGATVTLTALVLSAASASAQMQMTTGCRPQNSAFGKDPIIQVSVSFRTAVDVADARAASDPKAQEAARRTLYHMAADECAALSDTFKAECRLSSLHIFALVIPVNASTAASALNATANYELKLKSEVSAQ